MDSNKENVNERKKPITTYSCTKVISEILVTILKNCNEDHDYEDLQNGTNN